MDVRKGKTKYRPFHYLNQIIKIILLGLIFLSVYFAVQQIKSAQHFPVKTVSVYGVSRVDCAVLQSALTPLVNHGFFNVKLTRIRERLLAVDWVADVAVRRRWPNEIVVNIIEKNAVARWNEVALLSDAGDVFMPQSASYPEHLPQLNGPPGKQLMMLQYFNEINRLFTPLHVKILNLALTPHDAWQLSMSNGVVIRAGHKDILTRLGQFVKVYPQIVGNHAADVEYVDLRYSNGLAVRWKNTQGFA